MSAPPRQAPPGLRGQGQRRARGHRLGRQADRGGPPEPRRRCPSDKQKAVRNNGGGHYNHSLFWESMSPDGGGEPGGDAGRGDQLAPSAPSTTSRRSSRRPASGSSARAGRGSSSTARASRSSARQPGQPDLRGPDAAAGRRRLGARLLPQVPEQAPGLPRGVVERRQLGARSPSATRRWPAERHARLLRGRLHAARRGRGAAPRPLARARRALEGRPRARAVRPRRAASPPRWSRSGAATARCWPSCAASRRCSTASSCPLRPPSWRAAHVPRRGGSSPTTAPTCPPRTASTTSRCSRTCSSTSPTRAAARRGRAGGARGAGRGAAGGQPLRRAPGQARARPPRIGHLHALRPRGRRDDADRRRGPAEASRAELHRPAPVRAPRFFARAARRAAAAKWALRARAPHRLAPRTRRAASSPCTTPRSAVRRG